MNLVVFSHKLVWPNPESPSGFATDGGFAFQMDAISQLFDATTILVPATQYPKKAGEVFIKGKNLTIQPIKDVNGTGFKRKINYIPWMLKNLLFLNRLINSNDAVHTPIPSDIATLGMVLAKIKGKPLFVRYCGNWLVQKTKAEKLWRRFLERYAGGNTVVLATGLLDEPPSVKNKNIKWIFSSSLTQQEIELLKENRPALNPEKPRLIIACRIDENKGVGKVIEAVQILKKRLPAIHLDIVGEGPYLKTCKEKVTELELLDEVTFHGKLNHEQVLSAMKNSNFFCFPTESEGFPKVVVEALACGLPVFATPVSAIPALLVRGGGVILKDSSAETLAAELFKTLEKPDTYIQMQNCALKTVEDFTLEAWARDIKQHLDSAWKN